MKKTEKAVDALRQYIDEKKKRPVINTDTAFSYLRDSACAIRRELA